MNKILSFLFFLSLFSCDHKGKTVLEKNNIPVISFEKEGSPFSEQNLAYFFIPLETVQTNLLGAISQVEIYDDRIFVLDNMMAKRLFVFTQEGKYITQIGDIGGGPGEYAWAFSFILDKKKEELIIVDRSRAELLFYDLKNYVYKHSKKMPYHNKCSLLSDGGFAFFYAGGFTNDKRKQYHLKVTDSMFVDMHDCYPAGFVSPYGSGCGSEMHSWNGKTFVHANYDPIVWEVTSTGISSAYQIQLSNLFPPVDWLREKSANSEDYIPALLGSEYVANYAIQETSDYINLLYVSGEQMYNCFYHKESKTGYYYPFPKFIKYMGIEGGIKQSVGVYKDYFISYLSADLLKKYSVQNEKLRVISEQLSAEDNPVLFLFKFK